MASWGASRVDFAAENFFTAPPKPTMGSGTAAITAVESLATSTGVNMNFLKTVGTYLSKVQGRLVNSDTYISAAPMAEIDEALDAFKTHTQMLQSKISAQPIDERMLALEKATKKSLEEPARKSAPRSAQTTGGRPTYASIFSPPATKAAVRIRVD